MWKSKEDQCGNHIHSDNDPHRKRKRGGFCLDCSRSGPTSLNVGTMWELFGKANAPEARSEAFLEVRSGIEPL